MKKRLIVIGDLHCGHRGGLTPPAWQISGGKSPKINALQSEMWKKYRELVRKYKAFDGKLMLVCNGDAIDGDVARGELTESDLLQQVKMAQTCIDVWGAKEHFFMEGTPFHTGKVVRFEEVLADKYDEELLEEEFLTINGHVFYFRHKVGRSGLPHGRHTAPAKESMLNRLEYERGQCPKANTLCFSHVHYHTFCGYPGTTAMTLPALQTISNYGGRECSGQIDWGITVFDVDNSGSCSWVADTQIIEGTKKVARKA